MKICNTRGRKMTEQRATPQPDLVKKRRNDDDLEKKLKTSLVEHPVSKNIIFIRGTKSMLHTAGV
jgi:hypothetical protein